MTWKVHVEREFHSDWLKIWAYRRQPGKTAFMTHVAFTDVDEGTVGPEAPSFQFAGDEGREFLQAFMDAAWEQGIRPVGLEDHTNELKATKFHLEDMRLLAKVVR